MSAVSLASAAPLYGRSRCAGLTRGAPRPTSPLPLPQAVPPRASGDGVKGSFQLARSAQTIRPHPTIKPTPWRRRRACAPATVARAAEGRLVRAALPAAPTVCTCLTARGPAHGQLGSSCVKRTAQADLGRGPRPRPPRSQRGHQRKTPIGASERHIDVSERLLDTARVPRCLCMQVVIAEAQAKQGMQLPGKDHPRQQPHQPVLREGASREHLLRMASVMHGAACFVGASPALLHAPVVCMDDVDEFTDHVMLHSEQPPGQQEQRYGATELAVTGSQQSSPEAEAPTTEPRVPITMGTAFAAAAAVVWLGLVWARGGSIRLPLALPAALPGSLANLSTRWSAAVASALLGSATVAAAAGAVVSVAAASAALLAACTGAALRFIAGDARRAAAMRSSVQLAASTPKQRGGLSASGGPLAVLGLPSVSEVWNALRELTQPRPLGADGTLPLRRQRIAGTEAGAGTDDPEAAAAALRDAAREKLSQWLPASSLDELDMVREQAAFALAEEHKAAGVAVPPLVTLLDAPAEMAVQQGRLRQLRRQQAAATAPKQPNLPQLA
eukprot:357811-Chlamydomonas_euryale.AAC.8